MPPPPAQKQRPRRGKPVAASSKPVPDDRVLAEINKPGSTVNMSSWDMGNQACVALAIAIG
eukprot:SAG22_NODE_7661_length_718_cov_1.454839_1_plen_60_part_01